LDGLESHPFFFSRRRKILSPLSSSFLRPLETRPALRRAAVPLFCFPGHPPAASLFWWAYKSLSHDETRGAVPSSKGVVSFQSLTSRPCVPADLPDLTPSPFAVEEGFGLPLIFLAFLSHSGSWLAVVDGLFPSTLADALVPPPKPLPGYLFFKVMELGSIPFPL